MWCFGSGCIVVGGYDWNWFDLFMGGVGYDGWYVFSISDSFLYIVVVEVGFEIVVVIVR